MSALFKWMNTRHPLDLWESAAVMFAASKLAEAKLSLVAVMCLITGLCILVRARKL